MGIITKNRVGERKFKLAEPQTKAGRVGKVLASIAMYCMGCRTKLATKESKRFRLCAVCRRYCTYCGREAEHFGHFGVCRHCVVALRNKLHDAGKKPTNRKRNRPDAVMVCECCGGEAVMTPKHAEARCLCDECSNELEGG